MAAEPAVPELDMVAIAKALMVEPVPAASARHRETDRR